MLLNNVSVYLCEVLPDCVVGGAMWRRVQVVGVVVVIFEDCLFFVSWVWGLLCELVQGMVLVLCLLSELRSM